MKREWVQIGPCDLVVGGTSHGMSGSMVDQSGIDRPVNPYHMQCTEIINCRSPFLNLLRQIPVLKI